MVVAQRSAKLYDLFGPASNKSFSEQISEFDMYRPTQEITKVATSRIRVLLNRPLTWAEKEELETDYNDEHYRRINYVQNLTNDGFKVWVSPNREHVWAEARFGSRVLFEVLSSKFEHEFVNLFPRAVRTFREYNGE